MIKVDPGKPVVYDGSTCVFIRVDGSGAYIFERELDKSVLRIENNQLVQAYAEGRFAILGLKRGKKPAENSTQLFHLAPKAHQAEARRRHSYVKAMLQRGIKTYTKDLQKFAVEHASKIEDTLPPPSPRTLQAWKKIYIENDGNLVALLPDHTGKGRRSLLEDPDLAALWEEAKTSVAYSPNQRSIADLHKYLCSLITIYNQRPDIKKVLRLPDKSTVQRWLKDENVYEIVARQSGREKARQLFGEPGAGFKATRVLELVEVDASPMPNRVWDPETRKIRQPVLLVAVDSFSRAPLGWHICFSEDVAGVLALYEHCFWPKEGPVCDSDGVIWSETEFPVFGVPERIISDNGTAFRANRVETALDEVGCVNRAAVPKKPTHKPVVERFFRTVFESFGKMNTVYIRKNSTKYRERDAGKEGLLTLDQYRAAFSAWVRDVYMFNVHSAIQETPFVRWQVSAEKYLVKMVEQPLLRALFCAEITERRPERRGVMVNHRWYNSNELTQMFMRTGGGNPCSVYFTGTDPEFAYVLTHEKTFIKVTYRPCHGTPGPAAPAETMDEAEEREKTLFLAKNSLENQIRKIGSENTDRAKNTHKIMQKPKSETVGRTTSVERGTETSEDTTEWKAFVEKVDNMKMYEVE